jgi:hypothetical protein
MSPVAATLPGGVVGYPTGHVYWLAPVVAAGDVDHRTLAAHKGALVLDGVLCVPGDRIIALDYGVYVVSVKGLLPAFVSGQFPIGAWVEEGQTYGDSGLVKDNPSARWAPFAPLIAGGGGSRPRGPDLMRRLIKI